MKYIKFIPVITTIIFAIMWYSSDIQLKSHKLAYEHQAVKYIKGKTKIVYRDKIIDRIVDRVIYREIKPDGSITEKIEEKEKENIVDNSKIDTKEDISNEKKPIFAPQTTKDWMVGLSYPIFENSEILGDLGLKSLYVEVNRRILCDIYMGIETNLRFDTIKFGAHLLF